MNNTDTQMYRPTVGTMVLSATAVIAAAIIVYVNRPVTVDELVGIVVVTAVGIVSLVALDWVNS